MTKNTELNYGSKKENTHNHKIEKRVIQIHKAIFTADSYPSPTMSVRSGILKEN